MGTQRTMSVPSSAEPNPANARRSEEIIFRNKSTGETGIREVTTVPITDQHGKTIRIILTSRDLTEQRRLDEARSRLAAIVDSSGDAIIGKDETGVITSWNEGAEKVFGYSAEEMIGQSIKRLLPADRAGEEVRAGHADPRHRDRLRPTVARETSRLGAPRLWRASARERSRDAAKNRVRRRTQGSGVAERTSDRSGRH